MDIVIFDGFCNFCSASVMFIIKRDPTGRFHFAASQSPAGKKLLERYGITGQAEHSIILIRGEQVFTKSGAALRIAGGLKGGWPLFSILRIFPPVFLDFLYGLLARKRYRLYGKREHCFLPDQHIKDRFL
jgi:predicted DCC family thiol-disulfide oxidoreductase YuxK